MKTQLFMISIDKLLLFPVLFRLPSIVNYRYLLNVNYINKQTTIFAGLKFIILHHFNPYKNISKTKEKFQVNFLF